MKRHGELARVACRPPSESRNRPATREGSRPPFPTNQKKEKKMQGKINVAGTIKMLDVGESFVFTSSQIKYTSLICACSKLRKDDSRVRYGIKTISEGTYRVTRYE